MIGKEEMEWGGGPGSLAREGRLYLDICAGATRVPSYATADWAGFSSQGRFEDPILLELIRTTSQFILLQDYGGYIGG